VWLVMADKLSLGAGSTYRRQLCAVDRRFATPDGPSLQLAS
jgi:hypothetical protein